jgi:hypothetical protein
MPCSMIATRKASRRLKPIGHFDWKNHPDRAYPLRPGITFTYLGVKVDEDAKVLGFDNVYCRW